MGIDARHAADELERRLSVVGTPERAKCLAILVASPKLLDIRCRTVEQMRLANALCLLVERAEP